MDEGLQHQGLIRPWSEPPEPQRGHTSPPVPVLFSFLGANLKEIQQYPSSVARFRLQTAPHTPNV